MRDSIAWRFHNLREPTPPSIRTGVHEVSFFKMYATTVGACDSRVCSAPHVEYTQDRFLVNFEFLHISHTHRFLLTSQNACAHKTAQVGTHARTCTTFISPLCHIFPDDCFYYSAPLHIAEPSRWANPLFSSSGTLCRLPHDAATWLPRRPAHHARGRVLRPQLLLRVMQPVWFPKAECMKRIHPIDAFDSFWKPHIGRESGKRWRGSVLSLIGYHCRYRNLRKPHQLALFTWKNMEPCRELAWELKG